MPRAPRATRTSPDPSVQNCPSDHTALGACQGVKDHKGARVDVSNDRLDPADLEPRDDAIQDVLLGAALPSVAPITAPARTASPMPAPRKKPPNTAVSTRSGVTSGYGMKTRARASPAIPSTLRTANARPSWCHPTAMNGRFTRGRSSARGSPVVFDSNMDTPVTPPSMKLLDSRNPFSPMPADRMPNDRSTQLSSSRRNCFTI